MPCVLTIIVCLLFLLVSLVGYLVCDMCTIIVCLLFLLVSLVDYFVCDMGTDYHSLFALPLGGIGRLFGL